MLITHGERRKNHIIRSFGKPKIADYEETNTLDACSDVGGYAQPSLAWLSGVAPLCGLPAPAPPRRFFREGAGSFPEHLLPGSCFSLISDLERADHLVDLACHPCGGTVRHHRERFPDVAGFLAGASGAARLPGNTRIPGLRGLLALF